MLFKKVLAKPIQWILYKEAPESWDSFGYVKAMRKSKSAGPPIGGASSYEGNLPRHDVHRSPVVWSLESSELPRFLERVWPSVLLWLCESYEKTIKMAIKHVRLVSISLTHDCVQGTPSKPYKKKLSFSIGFTVFFFVYVKHMTGRKNDFRSAFFTRDNII